jgi:hypothetical protein
MVTVFVLIEALYFDMGLLVQQLISFNENALKDYSGSGNSMNTLSGRKSVWNTPI